MSKNIYIISNLILFVAVLVYRYTLYSIPNNGIVLPNNVFVSNGIVLSLVISFFLILGNIYYGSKNIKLETKFSLFLFLVSLFVLLAK